MPFYSYECKSCGPFEDWQSMARAGDPMACPACGRSSGRTISMPNIAVIDPHSRIAHQRNEKSADQPEVVRRERHDRDHGKKGAGHCHHGGHHGHGHGRSHGHSHGHSHGPSRPWMIGH